MAFPRLAVLQKSAGGRRAVSIRPAPGGTSPRQAEALELQRSMLSPLRPAESTLYVTAAGDHSAQR